MVLAAVTRTPSPSLSASPPKPDMELVSLWRETDPQFFNEVCNHKDVRPWLGGNPTQEIDTAELLKNPANYALAGDHGGIIFVCQQPGLYEAHTQVLPEGRGKWTLSMVLAALRFMFCSTDAVEIITRVPDGNRGARALVLSLSRYVPVTFEMRSEATWQTGDQLVGVDLFSVTIQDWMWQAPALEQWGRKFHKLLDGMFKAQGRERVSHPDDCEHDRFSGVAYSMVLAGQPYKAAVFYNRWAAMSGYHRIQVLSTNPLTLDLGDCAVRDGPTGWELLNVH